VKRYGAVIFDWDGTLMDSTHSIVSAIQSASADLDLPVPSAANASWVIGLSLESALYHAVPTLTSDKMPLFLERYRHHFFQTDTQIKLFDGVPEMLSGLRERQVLLGVATGKSRAGLDRVLQAKQMQTQFDITRCADETFSKPHPGMLLEIMDTLNVPPQQVLMVGDTSHDVQMAHNAGVDSLAVTYGAHDRATLMQSEPTFLVSNVREMRNWLHNRVHDLS
jgi:phosphoglycolate phosphatase